MDNGTLLLLVISGIVFLGYIADLIFKRFGVPHILFLMIIGFIIGPGVLGYVNFAGATDLNIFIGTFVLIIILFEGGMDLSIFDVIHRSGRAMLISFLEIILSAIICALLLFYIFGVNIWVGAIFGAIAGGSTAQIIIPLSKKLNISNDLKQFFIIESSATGGIGILVAIILLASLISNTFDFQNAGQILLSYLSIGAVLGLLIGIATIVLMSKTKLNYPYMMIIAVLIALYVFSEYFEGSGVMAVLLYGIVLGNKKAIGDMFKFQGLDDDAITRQFQVEISFFVGTFFAIYMGTLVVISGLSMILIAVVAMLGLVFAKIISAYITTFRSKLAEYNKLIIFMQAKGIEIAVFSIMLPSILLSQYPNSANLQSATAQLSILPELSFTVIILSILLNSFGLLYFKDKLSKVEEEIKKEEAEEEKPIKKHPPIKKLEKAHKK